MKVHYVFSHPSRDSFNGALLQRALTVFDQPSMTLTDLYGTHFNPVASIAETETIHSEEVHTEISSLQQADVVILQFPLWWFSTPAILKGWMDRVFVFGVTYDKERRFKTGGFAGKKAMLVTTTQATAESYQENGLNGPMDTLLFPIHHSLRFVGFETLPPFVAYDVARNNKKQNEKLLNQYAMLLREIKNA